MSALGRKPTIAIRKDRDFSRFHIRLNKSLTKRIVVEMAPEYLQMFRELQRPDGWRKVASAFGEVRKRLKLDGYVALYEDEKHIQAALALGLFGMEGLKEINAELKEATEAEQQRLVDEFAKDVMDEGALDKIFSESEAEEALQQEQFQALSDSEKQEATKRAQHLFAFFLCFFYNMLAVMVHGERLTSLVAKGLKGDQEAFGKAVHVDKFLLLGHAGFREQYEAAQLDPASDLLADISARVQMAPTKGRIRYPGVYCVFAMLESLGWLNDLTHDEILDICVEAKLDRWENRIEDVNYLTKRLASYRRTQRLGGLSMH